MAGVVGLWQRLGARRGVGAVLLLPLAALYALGLFLRRMPYRLGLHAPVRLPVPVIVVGNLVAGGAGKTPTVIALVEALRQAGRRPGIVSRGYGGETRSALSVRPDTPASRVGDEPVLESRRTGAPVFVGRDRVAAAQALLSSHPDTDVLVADDGLQHLRLARDVQVLVFDERGAGNGWLLPAGLLREPMRPAARALDVVLYNAERPSTTLPGYVAARGLAGAVSLQDWWQGAAPSLQTLRSLRGRRVHAVAGVARPARFFEALRKAGLDIEPIALPDHAAFDALPWPPDARDVVLTEKDAVKLPAGGIGSATVWVAALDFRLPPAFVAEVLRRLDAARDARHGHTPA
jgi:tetraacyldisaccharide 4'-kinase